MQQSVTLTTRVKRIATGLGFELVGVTDVRPSEHAAFYREWLKRGHHGEMSYLSRSDAVEHRLEPNLGWPALRSAVVVGLNYFPEDLSAGTHPDAAAADGGNAEDSDRAVIARYARGRDYHKVIKKKLLALLARIEGEVGHELPAARAYVDTGPVLERELASRAGLGWFGRSAMLINPKRGSYFFLGTLLLELDLAPDPPFVQDHCGTCSACVTACPTGALLGRDANGAPVVDATRCISYLTIEQRGPIPRDLRPLIGNRVFGCDICQEVCPFSRKFSTPAKEPDFTPRPTMISPSLTKLMGMSVEEWDEFSRGSPVRRAGRPGFLRNVAVALGNRGSDDAVPVLSNALRDPEPLIRGHAVWALGRIGSPSAMSALRAQEPVEQDDWVAEELKLALAGV